MKFQELAYISWAKALPKVEINLARSGIDHCPVSLLGLKARDLVATLPVRYGYLPLRQAIAARYGVTVPRVFPISGGTSFANWIACAAVLDGCGRGTEVIVERPTYEPLLRIPQTLGHRIRRLDRRYDEQLRHRSGSVRIAGDRAHPVGDCQQPAQSDGRPDSDGDTSRDGGDARACEGIPARRRGLPRVPVQKPPRIVRATRARTC